MRVLCARNLKSCGTVLLYIISAGFVCAVIINGGIVTLYANYRRGEVLHLRQSNQISNNTRLEIFRERRKVLLETCRKNGSAYVGLSPADSVRNHFVVDRNHKFVYCAMEKIGSTFWRRLFQIIVGSSNATSPFDIPPDNALKGNVETFTNLRFDDIHSLLESSKTFIIVRDPYARLYSGYMDKLFSANIAFWDWIGKFAIGKFRPHPSKKSMDCGHDLTFHEFIKYFIYSETSNIHRDGHFVPMYDHCRPCHIKYDIIAKMESMSDDTLSVLKMLNMSDLHNTLAKQFTEDTREDSFVDQTNILFASFESTKDCLSVYENQNRLWMKFKSRGLISKHAVFPFSSDESETLTMHKYIKALKQAVKETADKKMSNQYRYEYLSDAYSKLPTEDLKALHQILKYDCNIFGYDCDKYPWIENAFRQ